VRWADEDGRYSETVHAALQRAIRAGIANNNDGWSTYGGAPDRNQVLTVCPSALLWEDGPTWRAALPALDPIACPATADRGRILWPYALTVLGFHLLLGLTLVPWLFSWTGLLLIPLGNYVFCSLGIGAGFHRLLTHRSFCCPRWLEHVFALLGVCSLQDATARWVICSDQ